LIFYHSNRKVKKRPNPLCRNHTLTMSYSALLFKRSDFYLYKNPQKNERKDKSNQMRNVIFAINTTLDGCCDHIKFNPDVAKNHSGQTKADIEFAQAFDAVDKIIVFSQSLDSPEGKKTRIVRTSLQEKLQLKLVESTVFKSGGVALRYLKQ